MAQVQCLICKQTKDSTFDYYWNAKGRQGHCKECQKAYVKAWKEGVKTKTLRNQGKSC